MGLLDRSSIWVARFQYSGHQIICGLRPLRCLPAASLGQNGSFQLFSPLADILAKKSTN